MVFRRGSFSGMESTKAKFMAGQPTPANVPPPRNKALLRTYSSLVFLNKALLNPTFWWGVAITACLKCGYRSSPSGRHLFGHRSDWVVPGHWNWRFQMPWWFSCRLRGGLSRWAVLGWILTLDLAPLDLGAVVFLSLKDPLFNGRVSNAAVSSG